VARTRWPEDIPARALVGYGSAALGLYADAAEEFLSIFAGPNGFCIPEVPSDGDVDEQPDDRERDAAESDHEGPDITLRGEFNGEQYVLRFAYALLHSDQVPVLQELVRWVSTQPALLNGDWKALQGETFRLAGHHELAVSQLEGLGAQPPAAATRALSYLDQGNAVAAREAAVAGLGDDYAGKSFNHPLGDPRAICTAALGLADAQEGHYDTALEHADRAIICDGRCPVGWLAKSMALSGLGLDDKALIAAEDGLRHCPGNPDLYEWHQEKCLESGRLDSAASVQEEMREPLLSRNNQAFFYALQARISEARFDQPATRVRMLIRAGEGTGLEFKSTLRWNVRAGKADEEMTYACIKTIAAFLNTNGGTLLIGVADDGSILGIEQDGFPNNDRFLQHLSNKILSTLGEVAAADIESRIYSLDGRSVCEVVCRSSKVPIYLRSKTDEEFYVRTGPRSDRLSPSKLVEYVRTRFTA
jgi:hypothetical protein